MRRPFAPLLALALSAPAVALAQTTAQPEAPAAPAAPAEVTPTDPAPAAGDAPVASDRPADPPADAASTREPVRPTPPPLDLLDRIGQAVQIHGNFRVRPEMMHNFAIGWDRPSLYLASPPFNYRDANWPWARNPENGLPRLCSTAPPPGSSTRVAADCSNNYQTMANLRLRIQPEVHITDGIAVFAQIDALENLVMGSTPQGYYNGAGQNGSPWAATTAQSQTQVQTGQSPTISVSRAWAEVSNPTLGQVRFGRMPWHWGLGIYANAGNGIDSDYQTHVDRVMYQLRIRSLGLFAAAMYDFASTGPTSVSARYEPGQGQPIDLGTLDDVNQYGVAVGRRVDASDARQSLARGDVVWNGGLYGYYRRQVLTLEGARPGEPLRTEYLRRDATIGFADLWFQLLHRNFRLEVEAAVTFGNMNFASARLDEGSRMLDVFQFGGALEFEYRLLNNRLQIEFKAGYASGDADIEGLNSHASPTGGAPIRGTAQASTLFNFHPDYRVDLILWRQVFRQVSGAYYFRPGVMYAFVDRPGGDRFYGRASVIWSRASEFVQTRGNAADLGIEVNAEVTYISSYRDPLSTDRPTPGFFASAQYGILFPMAGLGPTQTERTLTGPLQNFEFSNAQTLRAVLGVIY
jgi:uncharacterized protein (TIGR04551 family)